MTTAKRVLEWLEKQQKKKEIALYNVANKPNRTEQEIDSILEALDVIEYLQEGLEKRKEGVWYKETIPAPENSRYSAMAHYRLLCPFCGRRNGKRRDQFCGGCGAMLK